VLVNIFWMYYNTFQYQLIITCFVQSHFLLPGKLLPIQVRNSYINIQIIYPNLLQIDIGSIDPINNLITLVFTNAETENHRKTMNALLTISINSCEYSWIEFSHGNEYILIGPQFSY